MPGTSLVHVDIFRGSPNRSIQYPSSEWMKQLMNLFVDQMDFVFNARQVAELFVLFKLYVEIVNCISI